MDFEVTGTRKATLVPPVNGAAVASTISADDFLLVRFRLASLLVIIIAKTHISRINVIFMLVCPVSLMRATVAADAQW